MKHRVTGCINPSKLQCPSCSLTYSRPQSRLRHFIWSHQDLERLVMQDFNVRLSEFQPSVRDLEIVRKKCERKSIGNGHTIGSEDFKDLTDLAALPVHDHLDLKSNMSSCELCGEEFKSGVNKATDKGDHLLAHFKDDIFKDLPAQKPFKCPKCTFIGKDIAGKMSPLGSVSRCWNKKMLFISKSCPKGSHNILL